MASGATGGHYWRAQNSMFGDGHVAAMGASAFTIWCCLRRYTNRNGLSWPSVSRLSKETAMSYRNVQLMLKRLMTLGYVKRESEGRCTPDGHGENARYRLSMPASGQDHRATITPPRHEMVAPTIAQPLPGGHEKNDVGVVQSLRPKKTYKKKTKEKKVRKSTSAEIPKSLSTPEFIDAWDLWKQHRTEKRKKLTPSAQRVTLKELEPFGADWATTRINAAVKGDYPKLVYPDNKPGSLSQNPGADQDTDKFTPPSEEQLAAIRAIIITPELGLSLTKEAQAAAA